jgi:basic amino acid/polyamine antiporter, APA family
MTTLARKLRLVDYFALAFGVMVGTAWLVVMDDILQRGGPLGALLGFTAGALMLLPIGYVYGHLVRAIPDAAGEAAYVAQFFPPSVSFATGWMVFLSYFLTCPFETLAAGRIAGYLFPSLNTHELYRLGGYPVYLPHILLGLAITIPLTWVNYRGIRAGARLGKITTFTFLTLVILFALAGARHGDPANFHPLFSHAPLISILLVWQVVPWLLAGFESVGKYAEGGELRLSRQRIFRRHRADHLHRPGILLGSHLGRRLRRALGKLEKQSAIPDCGCVRARAACALDRCSDHGFGLGSACAGL